MPRQLFGGSEPLDLEAIRQSPRQFVDLETVEKLSDYAMVCELKIERLEAEIVRRQNSYVETRNMLLKEVAARALVIKQMAQLVDNWANTEDDLKNDIALYMAFKELQPSTDALDEYVQQQLREIISQKVIEEREACAKVCESDEYDFPRQCAAAIRGRK